MPRFERGLGAYGHPGETCNLRRGKLEASGVGDGLRRVNPGSTTETRGCFADHSKGSGVPRLSRGVTRRSEGTMEGARVENQNPAARESFE